MTDVLTQPAGSPAPPKDINWNDFDQRSAAGATGIAASLAVIEKRWGIKNPPIFTASQLRWGAFFCTADSDFIAGKAIGLGVLASIMDENDKCAGHVATPGCPNGALFPIVAADTDGSLIGVIHRDDFNHFWADS